MGKLIAKGSYPERDEDVVPFYMESERLVRFLSATDKRGFAVFFEAMSNGSRFDTALEKGFGRRFFDLDALEKEFKPFANKRWGWMRRNRDGA